MDTVMDFFKGRLENHLAKKFGPTISGVVYLDSTDWDPVRFSDGKITLLVVNIEEEKIMRPDHPYRRENETGDLVSVRPPLRLNFYFLFVAKFTDNKEAWKQLYEVIAYFQNNNFFNRKNAPDLPEQVYQLIMELKSLTFTEQNEIWSSLKAAYHPSVMYKTQLHIIQGETADTASSIEETRPQYSPM